MPIGYGSRFDLTQLNREVIGRKQEPKPFNFINVIRQIVNIVSIGASFFLGPIAEIGVSLAVGAVNQVLDAREGTQSVLNTLFNFGLPVITFFGGRVIQSFSRLKTETKALSSEEAKSLLDLLQDGKKNIQKQKEELNKIINNSSRKTVKIVGSLSNTEQIILKNILIRGIQQSEQLGLNSLSQASRLEILNFFKGIDKSGSLVAKSFQKELKGNLSLIPKIKNLTEAQRIELQVSGIIGKSKSGILELKNEAVLLENESKSIWARPASAEFNDKVVQRIQAIFDPNDLGRAPVEFAYRKLKEFLKNTFKSATKIISKAEKVEEAFIKTGGAILNSDWLLGYKIIKDTPWGGIIMISFKSEATNGKKPVIVYATHRQLKALINSPGRTYLKYFALSRGGAKLDPFNVFNKSGIFGAFKIFSGLSGGVLAFFPRLASFLKINALRNILSIVSNVVENSSSIAKGTYTGTYWSKFKSSFVNVSITRVFRLVSQGILGPLLKNKFGNTIGRIISVEFQRFSGKILGGGLKNIVAGKAFTKGLTSKVLISSALAGVKTNGLKVARRKNPNSQIIKNIALTRKAHIIGRIPNALVPGRPWRGKRFR